MLRYLVILFVLFDINIFVPLSFAQKQGNIWYFGDGAGLDFNNNPPAILIDGQTSMQLACGDINIEGTSSIADSSGSLLFYTDGTIVWNKNHQVMPNGSGLMGGISSTQSSLIVPKPNSNTEYYLFTTDDFCNDLNNGLRYSLIDMCIDGELGDVVAGQKNILLLDTVAEKLTAVKHANGVDYWIITHKYFSDAFYVFLLTEYGITDTVILNIGSVHQGGGSNNMWRAIGQLKASPDGYKLAIGAMNGANLIEIFDFDNSSGLLSNFVSITTLTGAYGLSFSPDNSKLYTTPLLTQYDLLAGGGNPDSINNSAYNFPQSDCINGLQLAPNGKIYAVKCNDMYLGVINTPNAAGAASNFVDSAISLGNMVPYSLPNFIDSYDYHNGLVDCSTSINEKQKANAINIYPNPFSHSTEFSYTIGTTGHVELLIHSYTGQHITTLISEKQNSGSYSVSWDTSDIAPGVYFCTLRVEGVEQVRKAVKIR